jgi:hypothetical protein
MRSPGPTLPERQTLLVLMSPSQSIKATAKIPRIIPPPEEGCRLLEPRVKVATVLPDHAVFVRQAHVRLVDQCGRLQGVVCPLSRHQPSGDALAG